MRSPSEESATVNYKIKCINFSKNFLGSARGFFLKKPLAPKDFLKRLFAGAASRSPTEYGESQNNPAAVGGHHSFSIFNFQSFLLVFIMA